MHCFVFFLIALPKVFLGWHFDVINAKKNVAFSLIGFLGLSSRLLRKKISLRSASQ